MEGYSCKNTDKQNQISKLLREGEGEWIDAWHRDSKWNRRKKECH